MKRGGFVPLFRALVLRPIVHEKFRTAITVAGIAAGISVIIAIQLANRSALASFQQSVDAVSGRANFQIVTTGGTLDERVLSQLAPLWDEGARFAPVIDIDAVTGNDSVPVRILAVDLLSDLHFRDYKYARIATANGGSTANDPARNPEALARSLQLFADDSIIVPQTFAAEHHLRIGSSMTIATGTRREAFVVRGILEPRGPATAFNGSLALLDIATAQKRLGMAGRLTRVDLLLPDETSAHIVAQLQKTLPANLRVERPSTRSNRVVKMLRAFRVNLFALAAVALLVGIFLVYNTVLISILRRRRTIGIAKTLGASPLQIFFCFVSEGALFGAIGSAAGIALGVVLARATLGLVARTISELYVAGPAGKVTLGSGAIATGFIIGLAVSIFAAAQPALEASRLRPNLFIRPGLYQQLARRSTGRLLTIAVVLFAAAYGAARIPPLDGISVGGYASVTLVIAAFSALSAPILLAASAILRPLAARMFGIVGLLATSSIRASVRRTAIATAALAISIAMTVSVAMMVGSFRRTVDVWVRQTVSSDLWLRPARALSNASPTRFPASILPEVRQLPFIAAADPIRGIEVVYRGDIAFVGGSDFDIVARYGELPMIAPRSAKTALREAKLRHGALVSEAFMLKYGSGVGDAVRLETPSGAHTVPITGVFRDYSTDRGEIIVDRSLFEAWYRDDTINTIAVYLNQGVSAESARREIERRLGSRYTLFAFTNVSIRREVMKIFDQTFTITYVLLVIALIVAVLGIVNTLTALILERRREIALLRVSGMTHREIRSMVVGESAIIGACSGVTGLVAGYLLSLILIYVVNRQSFGWTIEFAPPVEAVAGTLVVTFIATVAASIVPARLATRFSLAEELQSE